MKWRAIIVCFFCLVSARAQSYINGSYELHNAISDFIRNYQYGNYVPAHPMNVDSVLVNDSLRTIRLVVNESFTSQPINDQVIKSINHQIQSFLPSRFSSYVIDIVNNKGKYLNDFIPGYLRRADKSIQNRLWGKINYKGNAWVTNLSRPVIPEHGLEGRHLVLWASHGRYYRDGRWEWQRPCLFGTCEDLFTQTFVVPYLIPMLENAGAVVYTPRERDWQTQEAIVDNDDSLNLYREFAADGSKPWFTPTQLGYASRNIYMSDGENLFSQGSSRAIATTSRRSHVSSAEWIPRISVDGKYAVYVSYPTLAGSVSDAHYIVVHNGERTSFIVNQQIGGSTWVYLGTFEFKHGHENENKVILTNESKNHGFVAADVVRFGGGSGNVNRGNGVSRLPRFAEGSRYWTEFAGMPYSVYSTKSGRDDYGDDINARSHTLNLLGGGSEFIPSPMGRKVPFELSLAVHSDAGIRKDNSIFGSLAICTLNNENHTLFASNVSREASYDFADMLLQQVTSDLSKKLNRTWTRRELWNRNYSETRNPDVPSAIFEMLSHQNFGDMKLGHDPNFKFLMARSIYKAMLKFVSYQHRDNDYVVQPLPVKNFSSQFVDTQHVLLQWQPQTDSLDSSSEPTGYVVYTKIGDADFDNGLYIKSRTSVTFSISPGVIYSYKVCAANDGGISFPSEVLSVYQSTVVGSPTVLIVNGFDRLSGPRVVEQNDSLGFDLRNDVGVPYLCTAGFCGPQTNFNSRSKDWGLSSHEYEGKVIAGNTFSYPYIHGQAIAQAINYSFVSTSKAALGKSVKLSDYKIVDLIEGLQREDAYTLVHYKTFDAQLQNQLADYLQNGGRLFTSGAYIASDMHRSPSDSLFAAQVLKYTYGGQIINAANDTITGLDCTFKCVDALNAERYAVPSTDVLQPLDQAFSVFTYANSGVSAGIAYRGIHSRLIASGFPFEAIESAEKRTKLMNKILTFLSE